jgi:hypothetical protein
MSTSQALESASRPGGAPNLSQDQKEFLIAEYGHYAESFLHNEADGDRRATFFITVAGILAALVGNADSTKLEKAHDYLVGGLTAVLALGIFTFLRIVRRNATTDRYLAGLAAIRRVFFPKDDAAWVLPDNPHVQDEPSFVRELRKVGWLLPVAVVNGLLMYVAGEVQKQPPPTSAIAGILTAGALVLGGASERYRGKTKLRSTPSNLAPQTEMSRSTQAG